MTNALWFMLIGGLLLAMGLASSPIKRSVATPAIVYLAAGMLFGPTALNQFHFNPLRQAELLKVLAEVAVLISLFSAGVKMPMPFSLPRWRAPIMLATVTLAFTVGLIAVFAFYVLDLPLGACVLLGAILAPTDPVLATDVQIRHPGDHDQLRFYLTAEAGINDGSAFPLVVLGLGLLGLHDLGEFAMRWLLVDLVWATLAGIAIGVLAGATLAHWSAVLRQAPHPHELMDDFLGLGLIGVVYGVSVMVDAWGFLAVFFSGVALRHTELKLAARASQLPAVDAETPAVASAGTHSEPVRPPIPMVSLGSLVFKEHLERLSEVVLVLLVGGSLFLDSWSWDAVALALFLFVFARPVSVVIALLGTRTRLRIRGLVGWFGVRGIGSLYYLMYAIEHQVPAPLALKLIQSTLIVVTLSIVLHGISVKPLMSQFWRRP